MISRQRNELLCTAFLVGMRTMYTADQLVFMDETSKDDRALRRLYGYSYAGTRAPSRVPSVRGQRFSATAAIATTGLIAYDVVPGASNTTHLMRFAHTFLVRHVPMPVRARGAACSYSDGSGVLSRRKGELCVCTQIPAMNPYPGPRSVLVLDNCSFHHSEDVKALIQAAGIVIHYLPPYAPNLNPVL